MDRRSALREILRTDVISGAKSLIGWELVRGERRARIVETEAYRYADDPGCHAHGRTSMKNMAMFGPPGFAYVYLCYGVHWMLNVVAHPEDDGSAVLIRAAEPISGWEVNPGSLAGPGRLGAMFGLSASDNQMNLLSTSSELRLEPNSPTNAILCGPRIGLAAGKGQELPWRFVDSDRVDWASKPHKGLRLAP